MIARLNRWPKINSLNSYELAHLTDRSPRLVSETHSSVSDGVQRSNFFPDIFAGRRFFSVWVKQEFLFDRMPKI